ncbi:Bromodomain-containing factor 1 [Podospora fimiseda]|uniref:Bromodomain-containing factor 1 n=1 Tax=Podospora fimiseda TaxID=252190 RepID=A0AAN7BHT4_9PEZI|nr:Bromodomain-containing factor 1 [Podospora fimiseda]
MAVMTTQQSEGALLGEKPLQAPLALEKETLNGTVEVNGHSSPDKPLTEPELGTTPVQTDNAASTAETKSTKNDDGATSTATPAGNDEVADSNEKPSEVDRSDEMKEETIPVNLEAEVEKVDINGPAPPDTEMPDAPPAVSVKKEKPSKDESSSKVESAPESQPVSTQDFAPEAQTESQTEPKSDPELKETPQTSAKETPAADVTPLEATPSPKTVPASAFNADKEDVVMADTQEPAADNAESSTQETTASQIPPATPTVDATDAPIETTERADPSISASPQVPAKNTRERDVDSEDEPVAKRTKVEHQDRMDIDQKSGNGPASLYKPNGEPKTLDDDSLDKNVITEWQNRQIRNVLAGVKKTKVGLSFRQPVQTLWPLLWAEYSARVANPVDISSMEKRLRGDSRPYITLGDFKADLQLLVDNSVSFNGPNHEVTTQAAECRRAILQRMASHSAVEPAKPERKDFVKQHPTRHAEPRSSAPAAAPSPVQRPPKAASPAPKAALAENPAFAIPAGNNGVPLIRRDSTKADSRNKRPLKPAHSRDLPYDTKRKKKLPPELRFADEVLTELKKSKHFEFNGPFIQPVDPVALNIPTYYKIVKKPMDLSLMTQKLHAGDYVTLKDFDRDFELIVKNCKLFNGEDHIVYEQAKRLQHLYRTEMSKKDEWLNKHAPPAAVVSPRIKDESDDEDPESDGDEMMDDEQKAIQTKIAGIQERLAEEQNKLNNLLNAGNDILAVEISQGIIAMLQKTLMQERAKLTGLPTKKPGKPKPAKSKKQAPSHAGANAKKANVSGPGGASSGSFRKPAPKKPAPRRKITPAEKDVVTTYIGELDGIHLERAIDLIKKDTGQDENPDGELELDIEVLSDDVLAKIYDIVCKAHPEAKVVRQEKERAHQAAAEPLTNKKSSATKSKKNKPMSKLEQERRIQQLNELRAQATRQPSGSQEPMESIEGTGAAPAEPATAQPGVVDSDDELDSEED